jgi:hypothetical protein
LTKNEERSFNYKEGAQVCVQHFSYGRTKQSMADEFDKILHSIPLSPLFKKLIKIPLDITKDIRDSSIRQQNEAAIRRITAHLPEDAVREILNVPQRSVQNVRPHQQAPPPPPRPATPETLHGFKWARNSCALDSLYQCLYRIYYDVKQVMRDKYD